MDKVKSRFWLNTVTFFFLLCTAATGLINLIFNLLENHAHELQFIGIGADTWVGLHAFFAITTVVLILIHIGLHMDWISFAFKKVKNTSDIPPKDE